MIPKYYYCLLPSGNTSEFPGIELQLKRLNIGASYARTRVGKCYRIPAERVRRLPKSFHDERGYGPYLPTNDECGHSIYRLSHATISRWRWQFQMGSWIKL